MKTGKAKMGEFIGITGGIASGKSTVSKYLRQKGFVVVDADEIVHRLQAKGGELYKILVDEFGDKILDKETGEIDRCILGGIAFESPENLDFISKIQKQAIRLAILKELAKYSNSEKIFFFECAILVKERFNFYCKDVWTITCPKEEQIKHLKARNGFNEEEARKRVESQSIPHFMKVIENNGSEQELFEKIDKLLSELEV